MLSSLINRPSCIRPGHLVRYRSLLEPTTSFNIPLSRIPSLGLRFNSKTPTANPAPPTSGIVVKRNILVYHAGVAQTVFIGCLKVTTLIIFVFFGGIVVPAYWQSPDGQSWLAPLGKFYTVVPSRADNRSSRETGQDQDNLTWHSALLAGAVPLAFVTYTTGPWVTQVHVRLPAFARQSREAARRYVANLPPGAVLEIDTMKFWGRPRSTLGKVSEFYPTKMRLGTVNYARDKPPWYLGSRISRFSIGRGRKDDRERADWENVVKAIKRASR
ncbi:MAG: hypothetical protein M1818_002969 [Claussenomyces sp. TS43310]|nr:MAG: hypothetical protein M1818_002969 [Claussenomyces sp. TS43310]